MTTPLFVVGCARSGTTVFRRCLSTHPEIWLAKETQYLAFLPLSAGDWQRARTAAEMEAHIAFAGGFLPATGWQRVPTFAGFAASGEPWTYADFYRWLCGLERPARSPSGVWGDNTPRYVSLIPELDRAWPAARYLHVVRDPRDVVRSMLEVWFGGNTALTAAHEWMERVAAGLAAQRLVGGRLRLVRFEDLLREPTRTLRGIADWLGVADDFRPDDPGSDGGQIARQAHLARVAGPLDPSVIGRWQDVLSPEQVADIEQLCQPLIRAFGYEQPTWHPSWDPTPRSTRYAGQYAVSWAVRMGRAVRRRLPGAHRRSSK